MDYHRPSAARSVQKSLLARAVEPALPHVFSFLLLAFVVSCRFDDTDWPTYADGDADGDSDVDAGGDGDSDADSDGDSDTDGDGDSDAAADWMVGRCLDGAYQDEAGFSDCEDLECLERSACCTVASRPWVQGDFGRCESLAACGWSVFPTAEPVQALAAPWLRLTAASAGESGVYTEAVADMAGAPLVTFAAYLDPAGCDEARCPQRLGVAFTAQELLSAGTGVVPTAGIVLDGELEAVHLVVNGRIERSLPAPITALAQEGGYAIRLESDGSVSFWQGLAVTRSDDSAPVVEAPGEAPTFASADGQLPAGERLRLAIFGHFDELGAGLVGSVALDRPICDVPDGFERPLASPVFVPPDGASDIGRPAVVARPWGGELLMVHEHGRGFAVATSVDGRAWTPARSDVGDLGSQEGLTARRAPSLVFVRDHPVLGTAYHLWFEADVAGANDAPPSAAIFHASSPDGFDWTLDAPAMAGDAIPTALAGDPGSRWRPTVGQPSVVVMADGSLMMFFVGRNPATGATTIGRATSSTGTSWDVDETPLGQFGDSPLAFERDGVASPVAVRRGGAIHLWYTGLDGARSSIGYAVGISETGLQWSWTRLGVVLEPEQAWEAQRVQDPAVLTLAPAAGDPGEGDGTVAVLHLWYRGGLPGRGRIGLATREVPAQVETLDPASDL